MICEKYPDSSFVFESPDILLRNDADDVSREIFCRMLAGQPITSAELLRMNPHILEYWDFQLVRRPEGEIILSVVDGQM